MLGTRIAPIILKHDTRWAIGQLHILAALFLRTVHGTHWIRWRVGLKAPDFFKKSITFFYTPNYSNTV